MKLFFFSALFVIALSGSSLAGFDEGVAAYQSGDVPLAVKEFRASADEGHSDSQFNLGLMYEQGIGVGKDEKEAVIWYLKAAQQGNSNAQYNLAVLYENGRGCDVDFKEAHRWYREAVMKGDGLAVGNLGMLYLRGQGVQEDKIAGLALLLMSVTMDNSPENRAKQNISLTRGVTAKIIEESQKLASEMDTNKNVLFTLDQYLKK
ncbi:MAG: TPR repeat protein [Desulforhopalus sp.]|jgi:TPR repeat protein